MRVQEARHGIHTQQLALEYIAVVSLAAIQSNELGAITHLFLRTLRSVDYAMRS